ncbi:hypothetical protein BJ742DRAFT_774746 [Cladochytrium replicatum]|nr:hypothetical protein BJ742DRAFT_774746 [Cladochytrium replicatum]
MPPQPPSPLSVSIRTTKYEEHSTFDMDEDDQSVTLRRPSSRMNGDAPGITTSSPASPTSPTTPTTPCSASTRSRSSTNSLSSMSSASSLLLSQVPVVRRASVTDSILFSSFAETRVPTDIQLEAEDDTMYVEKIRQRRTITGPVSIPRTHTIAAHRSAPPSPHYRRSSRPSSPLTRTYRDVNGEPAELLDILQNLLDPTAPPPGPPPSAPLPPPPPRRTTSMNFEPNGFAPSSAFVPPRKDSLSRLRYVSAI